MAEVLDIGTLSGRIELEDRMSNILTLTEKALADFDARMKDTKDGAESFAAGVFKGELALDALKKAGELALDGVREVFDMMIEGGKVADVEETFARMSRDAGIFGDTLVTKVQGAMKGTIDDTDVMIRANSNMAAGLAMTEAQMETLAKGAWALSKTMGVDAKDALDRLSDAMVTGRTRGIAMLTGKIDLAEAEERFAKSLGVTVDHLTEEGKMQATRQTILERVAAATDRIGETTLQFGDKVRQVRIQWDEFWEQVSVGLSQSPVLSTMVDAVGEALRAAFGTQQKDLVSTLVGTIENVAITLLSVGEVGADVAGVIGMEWHALNVVWGDFLQIVDGVIVAFEYLSLGIAKLAGSADDVERINENLDELMTKMIERGKWIQQEKQAEEEWAVTTGKVKDALEGIRLKMVDAQKSAGEHKKTNEELAESTAQVTEQTKAAGAAEEKRALTMAMTKEEAKKLADAQRELKSASGDFHDTVAALDKTMVASIKQYLEAGVSQSALATVYGLTASQLAAINKERDEENKQMRIEADAAAELTKMWVAYSANRAMLVATDTEKIRLAADADYQIAVENAKKKHIVDQGYYDQLDQLRIKNIELEEQARLLADDRTLASLEQRIAQERDNYQFMLRHGRDYTDATINQQYEVWQALERQRDQWGKIGDQIDADTGQVHNMTAAVQSLAGAMSGLYESTVASTQAANQSTFGGSWAVTKDTLFQSMQASHSGVSMDLATAMAELGYSYGEIIGYRALENDPMMRRYVDARGKKKVLEQMIEAGTLAPPQGPRIPGFKEGGWGDFGAGTLVMLHGKEAITPLDGNGGLAGNSIPVTNHFYVNGTAADVARKISAEIMRNLGAIRKFSLG